MRWDKRETREDWIRYKYLLSLREGRIQMETQRSKISLFVKLVFNLLQKKRRKYGEDREDGRGEEYIQRGKEVTGYSICLFCFFWFMQS